MAETSTRERLITEAMRLFSEQGYRATSVAQIEAAVGLAPGSGALYHHFRSKDALLAAGIDRQLDRRHAMRDIRALFAGLGDLRTELTLLGRYALSVLDEEAQLLQVAARTPADQAGRLGGAYAALVDGLRAELTDWVRGWAPAAIPEDVAIIVAVGINALLGKRAGGILFAAPDATVPDDRYLTEWTAMLAGRIEALR